MHYESEAHQSLKDQGVSIWDKQRFVQTGEEPPTNIRIRLHLVYVVESMLNIIGSE